MDRTLTAINHLKERSLHFSELLKDQFYFATLSDINLSHFRKQSDSNIQYLYTDDELIYQAFNHDFGPLNLSVLYQYCKRVAVIFQKRRIVIHLTSANKEKRVNAAFLVGSYCIIYHHLLPGTVACRLKELSSSYVAFKNFAPFVHAGFEQSDSFLYLEDCLEAVHKAHMKQILDFDKFNLYDYLFYEKVENGDLNWIIPGKLIAFCDPQTYSESSQNYIKLYINYFRKNNVTTIIRLNKSRYDATLFTSKSFVHHDLIFLDGSAPTDWIMKEFLRICESSPGAVAVHCKAGLGRTGTLIACYLMKHYRFTALEAIAWVRICRPGSVVGCQQKWLLRKQSTLWKHGDLLSRPSSKQSQDELVSSHMANNQNLLPITIVKCHILDRETTEKDINCNNKPVTSETFKSISNGVLTCKERKNEATRMVKSNDTHNLTQGDYLNQIKLRRKHLNKFSNKSRNHFNLCFKPTISKFQGRNRSQSKKKDSNNNSENDWMERDKYTEASPRDSHSLQIDGKKITNFTSSRVLPH